MIEAIGRNRFPAMPRLSNKRSMVHVCDVVQMFLRALGSDKSINQLYLVTDGKEYSTSDIYRQIRQALGLPPRSYGIPLPLLRAVALFGDLIGCVRRRPFYINTNVINKLTESSYYSCQKAIDELGYQPLYDLSSALPEMIECYRQCRT
jgi:nucleoside-diphosphate-sugar epimerase